MPVNFAITKRQIVETGMQCIFFNLAKMLGNGDITSYLFSSTMLVAGNMFWNSLCTKTPKNGRMPKPKADAATPDFMKVNSVDDVYRNSHVAPFALIMLPITMAIFPRSVATLFSFGHFLSATYDCIKKQDYKTPITSFLTYTAYAGVIPALYNQDFSLMKKAFVCDVSDIASVAGLTIDACINDVPKIAKALDINSFAR